MCIGCFGDLILGEQQISIDNDPPAALTARCQVYQENGCPAISINPYPADTSSPIPPLHVYRLTALRARRRAFPYGCVVCASIRGVLPRRPRSSVAIVG